MIVLNCFHSNAFLSRSWQQSGASKMSNGKRNQAIVLLFLVAACRSVDGVQLKNQKSLDPVEPSQINLSRSTVSTSISGTSGNSTNSPFLIDELIPLRTQPNTKKLYTVKNGTASGLVAVKYKRNNTERSNDAGQRDERFVSFGCELCAENQQICTEGQ